MPEQNVIAVPGHAVNIEDGKEARPQVLDAFTTIVPFDQVRHLLSDKPLRRPNRTRPIEQPKE
jgi:hypothetical protein